jgi:sigma-B regulation protein RsbU (phosphoserine phosphatase)
MSSDDVLQLKKKIADLESLLVKKDSEIISYRQQLIAISQKIDSLMAQGADDVKLLTQVQKVLTPTEIPKIPGFAISRKFLYGSKTGGDYFDIFEHNDKLKFGILVASSSSYAMSALFLSLILNSSHTAQMKKGVLPHLVLQQIAAEINVLASPAETTSVFYGIIDRRDFTLHFCSAGRMDAYYLSSDKPIQILKSTNSALSKQFSEQLTSSSIEL